LPESKTNSFIQNQQLMLDKYGYEFISSAKGQFRVLSSLDEESTKEIKPRRPASPPLDFLESRQKVASTFARDFYGNQFTPELPRAAAGPRAGIPTKRASGIFFSLGFHPEYLRCV
jgi:hypothetical protein